MRGARIASIALAGASCMLAGCIESMFFYPDRAVSASPDRLGVRAEDVAFRNADGMKLHGWFLPASGSAKGTVLHLHGNAANISNHLPLVSWLPAQGFHVLMFDYRGFGRSEGKPTLDGVVDDAHAALAYVRTRPEVDATRLVIFGQSLGGATALRLLARDAAGVRLGVIDSAFASYRGIARDVASSGLLAPVAGIAASVLPPAERDPITALKSIRVPLIFVHGKRDSVVPSRYSEELHAAAGEPRQLWLVPGADHMMVFGVPGPWREKLVAALDAAIR
jgi:fermentation-respiration switch protein FrsA (DUF1100 family)